jgi:hypothetical protein
VAGLIDALPIVSDTSTVPRTCGSPRRAVSNVAVADVVPFALAVLLAGTAGVWLGSVGLVAFGMAGLACSALSFAATTPTVRTTSAGRAAARAPVATAALTVSRRITQIGG